MRLLMLGLFAVLLSACGATPPMAPTPPPLPEPRLEPIRTPLTVGDFSPGTGWPFDAEARNTGAGCASQVRGVFTFQAAGIVQTVDWQLDAARVVRPSDTFTIRGCCIGPQFAGQDVGHTVTFQWQTVRC